MGIVWSHVWTFSRPSEAQNRARETQFLPRRAYYFTVNWISIFDISHGRFGYCSLTSNCSSSWSALFSCAYLLCLHGLRSFLHRGYRDCRYHAPLRCPAHLHSPAIKGIWTSHVNFRGWPFLAQILGRFIALKGSYSKPCKMYKRKCMSLNTVLKCYVVARRWFL